MLRISYDEPTNTYGWCRIELADGATILGEFHNPPTDWRIVRCDIPALGRIAIELIQCAYDLYFSGAMEGDSISEVAFVVACGYPVRARCLGLPRHLGIPGRINYDE